MFSIFGIDEDFEEKDNGKFRSRVSGILWMKIVQKLIITCFK